MLCILSIILIVPSFLYICAANDHIKDGTGKPSAWLIAIAGGAMLGGMFLSEVGTSIGFSLVILIYAFNEQSKLMVYLVNRTNEKDEEKGDKEQGQT